MIHVPRMGLARSLLLCAVAVILPSASPPALSQLPQRFTDPADGMFDLSEWLLDQKGFLPVPILITEPAVGYGAGVAVAFFREPLRDSVTRPGSGGHVTPPDVFGFAAFATENGTKGAAAGGQWTFLNDRYRYRGGIGDVSINLDFYGVGGQLPTALERIGYNLKGFGSFQQAMVRLGEGDTFLGARWIYLDLSATLDLDRIDAGLMERQLARRSSGLGFALEHDTRDNIFTPNRGWIGAFDATFYDERIGSANDFQSYRAHVFAYYPVAKDWVVALRADARAARGEVPFYMLPFVDMRGIPAARFQDTNVALLETEVRYDLDSRWSLIGFLGGARAWGSREGFGDAAKPTAGGVGFRYLVARRLGIRAGLDYAWSSVDQAFYIQVGSAWR